MSRFFYELGRKAGPKLRTGRWWWSSLTGDRRERVAAEEAVGRDLAAAIEAQHPLDPDPEVGRYLEEVGGHLAARLEGSGRSFRFRVLAPGTVNAFALPGGFVYAGRSLLELAEWRPAEVAFVLGHEMAHVVLEHALKRLVSEGVVSTALRVLPPARVLGGWIGQQGRALLESAHSREREEEADDKGLALAWAAGFPADAGPAMLERLAALSGQEGLLDPYFSSHPPMTRRVARLRALATRLKAKET